MGWAGGSRDSSASELTVGPSLVPAFLAERQVGVSRPTPPQLAPPAAGLALGRLCTRPGLAPAGDCLRGNALVRSRRS